MPDLSLFFPGNLLAFLSKGIILLIIAIYLLFSLVVLLQVRSLRSLIRITIPGGLSWLPLLFILHLVLVISLFFLALVIL